MANIVAGGLEIQSLAAGYWFEISQGGLDAVAVVRGENVTIPAKAGQTHMDKVADHFDVLLHGVVFGDGSTPAVSYRTRFAALIAVFNPAATAPFNIVVHPTAVGTGGSIASGTATVTVEMLRIVGPPAIGDQVREIDIECRCIADPPAWVLA